MKCLFALIFCVFLLNTTSAQTNWQQQTNYTIQVKLDDSAKILAGNMSLEYINRSPDTLNYIWMHIWPNAFANDRTAFAHQTVQNGKTGFYFADSAKKGYIANLHFRQHTNELHYEFHPQHIDIIKVFLREPLLPGQKTIISTPFTVKLPYNFSRGGYGGNAFQVTQWYPKAAMYDKKGWHLYPYLEIGEFFNNFGAYDITIEIPRHYVVAATGRLQNKEEKEWLKQRINTTDRQNPSQNPFKKLRYLQDSIVDFAWFADPDWLVRYDTALLNGKPVETWAFFREKNKTTWDSAVSIIKSTLHFKSDVLGTYPYPVVSVVESPLGFAGGMEYPTITNISETNSMSSLRMLIKHEVGHNWFQAVLASNERKYPWMDEGFNSYYDRRYLQQFGEGDESLEEAIYKGLIKVKQDQPVNTPSEEFTEINFSLFAYTKAAQWMALMERKIGQPRFDSIMQQYYQDWKFRHPQPEDFKAYFDRLPGFDSDYYFGLLDKTEPLEITEKKGLRTKFFYSGEYEQHHNIYITPVIGFNHYDKTMFGVGIHNYQVPNNNFNFLLMPMLGTSSKEINVLARISYTARTKHFGGKLIESIDFAKFSDRRGSDSNQHKISGAFYKIAPAIRYVFPERTALSNVRKWIEWKTFFIGEKEFQYAANVNGEYYPSTTDWKKRYINRLTFHWEDNHAIKPSQIELQGMQGKEFVRWQATYKGSFAYSDKGYFAYRMTVAGFNYLGGFTSQKYYDTRLFQPKLTAARGWEDVTYSHYYFGRNENDGLWSKQIFERDGFMKLRTDLFSDLQGRSDEWIAAVNLSTSLPKKVFPLRFVRLFLDVGTYSETWRTENNQPNILYVGGLQLNIWRDVIEVYMPLVYSKVFRDNLKTVPDTKGAFKNISFNINLNQVSTKKLIRLPSLL